MSMTPLQRRRRLNALSKEHTIYVIVGPQDCALEPCGAFTWIQPTEFGVAAVSTDPAQSDEAYLVALHEIAHGVLAREGRKMKVLHEEAEAWRWAIAHSGLEMTPYLWTWLLRVLRNDLEVHASEHYELFREAEEGSRA